MELRHLRYFVAVAETENVSRAALKLHVSQPALSRQIRDLEDEIGFALFERTVKSLSLTSAGRTFLKEAQQLLQQSTEAVRTARAAASAEPTELLIGYSPTIIAHILPAILRAYQRAMPNAHVKLHDWTNEVSVASLRDGRLELALIVPPPRTGALRGLRYEALTQTRLSLAVPPQHPFAGRRAVTLKEAAREPFVTVTRDEYPDYHGFLAAMFAPTKLKLRIVEEHDGISGVISAVEAGTGVTPATEAFPYLFANRVKYVRVTPEPSPLPIGIAAPKRRLSLAAEKFIDCAKEAVATKEKVGERPEGP